MSTHNICFREKEEYYVSAQSSYQEQYNTVGILHKSIAGRYQPVRVADGPITARCRFIKNASWENDSYVNMYY